MRKAAAKKKAEAAAKEGDEAKKDEEVEINAEDVDVFSVEDVKDLGNGEPLFAKFAYEDWTLLELRFELHLLCHAFQKDLNDPERPRFPVDHTDFYYQKYFKKQLSPKDMGMKDMTALLELVAGTVIVDKEQMLEAQLSEDTPMENFVKLTEEHRRERDRRLDAGDETAKLKFARSGGNKQGDKWSKWQAPSGGGNRHQAPQQPPRQGGGSWVQRSSSRPAAPPPRQPPSYGGQKRPYDGPSGQPPATRRRFDPPQRVVYQPRSQWGGGGKGG